MFTMRGHYIYLYVLGMPNASESEIHKCTALFLCAYGKGTRSYRKAVK